MTDERKHTVTARRLDSVRSIAGRTGLAVATVHRFLTGENVRLSVAQAMLPEVNECPCCGAVRSSWNMEKPQ